MLHVMHQLLTMMWSFIRCTHRLMKIFKKYFSLTPPWSHNSKVVTAIISVQSGYPQSLNQVQKYLWSSFALNSGLIGDFSRLSVLFLWITSLLFPSWRPSPKWRHSPHRIPELTVLENSLGRSSPVVLVSFSLLKQNTWHPQLKGEVYFGLQFQ